jgi:hypothetical protein
MTRGRDGDSLSQLACGPYDQEIKSSSELLISC